MSRRTLLRNALVMPVAGPAHYGEVIVEDARIAAVRRTNSQQFDGDIIDCGGRVVMPGLINAHLHPELHVLKGIVEELDLHAWSNAEHFDAALDALSSESGRAIQRAAIRASIADCVLGGTTCIATYGVTVGADEVSAETLTDLGLRGHVTVRDTAFAPLPGPVQPALRRQPARMYRLHAEEALTPAELSAAAAALARGERLVMHAAETEQRLRLAIETFGTSTIRLLDRYQLLSPRMLLSHAVYVDREEREMLALSAVPVVSSPSAELKLADGIAPIVDLLELGVTVALGTDCAVCNNSDDMFLEMRQLGLAQKLRYGAQALSAEQILLSATVHGARALGAEGELGAVAEGMAADLAIIDVANPRMQPLILHDKFNNVAANLVYAVTGSDVTDVMVNGEWIVRERTLQTADAQVIWTELRAAARELYDKIL